MYIVNLDNRAHIVCSITVSLAMVAVLICGVYALGRQINMHLPCQAETNHPAKKTSVMKKVYYKKREPLQPLEQTKGKLLHFANAGPHLTHAQISAFEEEIRGQLPDDYKEFMLAHNGGTCNPELGLPWAGGIYKIFGFDQLLPDKDAGIRGCLNRLREIKSAKVKGYFPIAGTYNGDIICLSCRGKDAGKVFITAYKYKVVYIDDLVPVDVTMVPLADSFTDLLDYMVEYPPKPFCRIEDLGKRGTADDLKQYLSEGHPIDALGYDDQTILQEAVRFDNAAMVEACIKNGASLSGSVRIAVQTRKIQMIEMLAKAGADVNERDEHDRTPMQEVCGTALPGEEGELNRKVRDTLIKLGAVVEKDDDR